jgi:predicted membrane-bound spermidine synthase
MTVVLHAVFFASGVSAIVYQLVWQRVLLGLYGSHVESVTIVVTAFMLGLGIGALAGGRVADRARAPVLLFAAVEGAIGAFGFVSVPLFRWIGRATLSFDGLSLWLPPIAILLIPTSLMGATLPILVAYAARSTGNVGRSLGALYGVNTLGSAAGAVAAVLLIVGTLGQQGSAMAAALLNLLAAVAIVLTARWRRADR